MFRTPSLHVECLPFCCDRSHVLALFSFPSKVFILVASSKPCFLSYDRLPKADFWVDGNPEEKTVMVLEPGFPSAVPGDGSSLMARWLPLKWFIRIPKGFHYVASLRVIEIKVLDVTGEAPHHRWWLLWHSSWSDPRRPSQLSCQAWLGWSNPWLINLTRTAGNAMCTCHSCGYIYLSFSNYLSIYLSIHMLSPAVSLSSLRWTGHDIIKSRLMCMKSTRKLTPWLMVL